MAADHGAPVAGWAGSWLIYGGSAHLAALQTLDQSGAAAAILTGLLVNARLVVYSAALARRWPDQPRWFRFAAAGLIIDPTWAVAERHAESSADPAAQRRYFLAAGLTLGVGWSAAIAAGALLGARLDGRRPADRGARCACSAWWDRGCGRPDPGPWSWWPPWWPSSPWAGPTGAASSSPSAAGCAAGGCRGGGVRRAGVRA